MRGVTHFRMGGFIEGHYVCAGGAANWVRPKIPCLNQIHLSEQATAFRRFFMDFETVAGYSTQFPNRLRSKVKGTLRSV